jgi:hypothetical protein
MGLYQGTTSVVPDEAKKGQGFKAQVPMGELRLG